MDALELVIWGMALGAVAAVGAARLADALVRPSPAQLLGVAYHASVFVFVLVLSGVLATLWTVPARSLQLAQVLIGPVCVGLACYWIRGWLGADRRDRFMAASLQAAALLGPLAGVACLALPAGQRLPAAAAVSLLGGVLTLWVTVRAWLLGDRLAPVMAAGCLLTLPAIAGLYAAAMGLPGLDSMAHALTAACVALANGVVGFVIWRRDRHGWRARQGDGAPSRFDPVTKLYSGAGLVRKLITAQRRRRRSRRDGAVVAVMVFDVDRLTAQVGTAGVNDMFIAVAGRIQRQVGVVNTVGRYYDCCFVCLVEAIPSPAWLRTLGLRVASSARRPVEVSTPGGGRVQVRPDIGVGVVHLEPGSAPVEDILHDAQRMAQAARAMRSRAAIFDAASGQVVPVEQAQLGPARRHGRASQVPHAVAPVQRPLRA
jgi:GGDEF domain-containing protein